MSLAGRRDGFAALIPPVPSGSGGKRVPMAARMACATRSWNFEEFVEPAVKAIGPDLQTGRRVDQLAADAKPVSPPSARCLPEHSAPLIRRATSRTSIGGPL